MRERPALIRLGNDRYSPRFRDTGLSPYLLECAKAGKAGRFDVLSVERTTPPAEVAARLNIADDKASVLRRENVYVYQARYITNRGNSPLVLAFAQLCGATGLLALTLPVAGAEPLHLTRLVLPAILILGILGTGAAYVINYALITTEGPTAASVITYLVPAVVVALGVAVLGEPAQVTLIAGGALILLGMALVQRPSPPAQPIARRTGAADRQPSSFE